MKKRNRAYQTKSLLKNAAREWAERLNVHPSQIRVQKMRRKWASCSSNGWVCFSEDLLNEDRDFQEYVMVHDLLHLRVPNHGKLFKSLMSVYLPDWKKRSCATSRNGDRSL